MGLPSATDGAAGAPAAAVARGGGGARETALLRVSADRVSRLMDLVGELSLNVSELIRCPELAGLELAEFDKASHRLMMVVREVQDAAAELRLGTVRELFGRLRRMVRELERQTGKAIDLELEGEDTAIDKVVGDRLYEPLLHVIRNSADHGLEGPGERAAAGKPERGRIGLRASQTGNEIQITVVDDGRGLNRARILARARERGLVGPCEDPEDAALWKVIFQPGFSTADTVTALSGRGVGMDVLHATMKALRGRIAIESVWGRGTHVVLSIPVTLAFLDCLIMRVGRRLFATPIDVVAEILQPGQDQVLAVSAEDGSELVRVRDGFVPICRLQHFYGEIGHGQAAGAGLTALEQSVVVVFNTSGGRIGVPVDEMLDQQQVVMKPLVGQLEAIRAGWGCALLGTGEIALVLDCEKLAEGMRA